MKPITNLLVAMTIAVTVNAQSQLENHSLRGLTLPKAEAGIGFQILSPTGSFQENMMMTPGGLNGFYYHRIGNKFMLGGEMAIICAGHADYEIQMENGEMATLHEDEGMWSFMLGGRFNFIGNEKWRSYTEIRMGANTFYTSVSACDERLKEYNESITHGTSFVSSLGLGLNFDPKAMLTGDPGRVWIAMRGAYTLGTDVNYRQAPESSMRMSMNSHVYNSSISYWDFGFSASWQFR